MSIFCKVHMKNGTTISFRYACFGFLRSLISMSGYEYSSTKKSGGSNIKTYRREFLIMNRNISPKDVLYVDYIPADSSKEYGKIPVYTKKKEIFKEAHRIFRNFPMMKGCIKVMEREGVIRAEIKNNPADKVVLSLMIMRNFLSPENNSPLPWLLENGFGYRKAIIVKSFLQPNIGGIERGSYINTGGEDGIVDISTFGKLAMLDFINQDKNYNPWTQGPYSESQKGYLRDSDFEEDDAVFNPLSIEPEFDSYHDFENEEELDDCERTYFRKLVSCFSTHFRSGVDVPLEGFQSFNIHGELYVPRFDNNLSIDCVKRLLQPIKDLK